MNPQKSQLSGNRKPNAVPKCRIVRIPDLPDFPEQVVGIFNNKFIIVHFPDVPDQSVGTEFCVMISGIIEKNEAILFKVFVYIADLFRLQSN